MLNQRFMAGFALTAKFVAIGRQDVEAIFDDLTAKGAPPPIPALHRGNITALS
jgi:hypothetical protein